jgi:hypothetical protein
MRILTWVLSLIVFATAWTSMAAAQCERHFYNHSNVSWRVGISGTCNGSPGCTILPHSSATLIYVAIPSGLLTVSSPFYQKGFGLTGCLIIHSGNTGYIAVNDPADGDVTTCGDPGWSCPFVRGRQLRNKHP